MADDLLKGVDMDSTWSWYGDLEEVNLFTYRGEFQNCDNSIMVKIVNEDGDKLKVRFHIQEVEILEVIKAATEKDELLELLDNIYGLLEGMADGAEDTEDYEESERIFAIARDRATRAYNIAKNLN
tara:strand:- start:44 stop:421 length:378 start_codon:yes stop_codon:yes gene_type:complete